MQSLQERVREHQRKIRREASRVEREIMKLREKRKGLCRDCKHYANKGEMTTVKTIVKQIRQTDQQQQVYQKIKLNCTAMEHQLGQVQSTAALQKTLKASVSVMNAASRGASLTSVNQSVGKYMQKMEETELKFELMDDACNAAFEDDEEAEAMIEKQILDELGIDLQQSLPVVPAHQRVAADNIAMPPKVKMKVADTVYDKPNFGINPVKPRVSPFSEDNPCQVKPSRDPAQENREEVYDGVASALEERLRKLNDDFGE